MARGTARPIYVRSAGPLPSGRVISSAASIVSATIDAASLRRAINVLLPNGTGDLTVAMLPGLLELTCYTGVWETVLVRAEGVPPHPQPASAMVDAADFLSALPVAGEVELAVNPAAADLKVDRRRLRRAAAAVNLPARPASGSSLAMVVQVPPPDASGTSVMLVPGMTATAAMAAEHVARFAAYRIPTGYLYHVEGVGWHVSGRRPADAVSPLLVVVAPVLVL
jgi:hypothetical protein